MNHPKVRSTTHLLGKMGGRPAITKEHPTVRAAKRMHDDHILSIPEVYKTLNISRSTLYRYLSLSL